MTKKIILFVAPSGSGKTSIIKGLLDRNQNLAFAISATTRQPRKNEKDGHDYYFLSQDMFKSNILAGDFVEYAEVYTATFYGTLKQELERIWTSGKVVIMDVDVEGAQAMQEQYSRDVLTTIFVRVKDLETLERRLKKRGIKPDDLKERLKHVRFEYKQADKFDHILLNDNLDEAIEKAQAIVVTFVGR